VDFVHRPELLNNGLPDVLGEHQEIAEMLGCSIANSKSQLHNARMKLRRILLRSQHFRNKKNSQHVAEVGPAPSAAAQAGWRSTIAIPGNRDPESSEIS
jgi:hypothetical protein